MESFLTVQVNSFNWSAIKKTLKCAIFRPFSQCKERDVVKYIENIFVNIENQLHHWKALKKVDKG